MPVVAPEPARVRDPEPGRRLPVDLAAERRGLVDEQAAEPGPGGFGGGRDPGRPTTDDDQRPLALAHRGSPTRIPSRTGVWHARSGRPSIVVTQSKHSPMPQYMP